MCIMCFYMLYLRKTHESAIVTGKMEDRVNYKGEEITGIPELRKPEYGTGKNYPDGSPIPDWKQVINGDGHGFDKGHVEPNGKHTMKVVLPKHTRLIRYGKNDGSYTAPKGTEYEQLSLPYVKESVYYHEYEVIADSITVTAIVDRGRVARGFDHPGGGIQYFHPYTMIQSYKLGLITEIDNAETSKDR